jgi:7-cyano-7-deazaguanine synthase in queuosine biosynthesis
VPADQSPPRPGPLTVEVDTSGPVFNIRYALNAEPAAITVTYPFDTADFPDEAWRALGLGAAVYLSQLCLTTELRLGFPANEGMVDGVRPLLQMLYDVRRWKDGLPLVPVPDVRHPGALDAPLPGAPLDPRRALLMFSGGKDSTLSALLLAANGYQTEALHVPINAGAEVPEEDAVAGLAGDLGLPVQRLGYAHPDFLAFSGAHTAPGAWHDFPLANRVPFGRDMLLALLALPVAAQRGAGVVSLGHDHECRNAYFDYGGRSIPRNDVESTRGALALEAYARRYALPGVRLLPPVAALSELRILHAMLVGRSELMARASFCFWGRNCGRCAKCVRYYLAQRLFGIDVLQFEVNPLAPGAAPELDDLLRQGGVGLLFQRQVLLCVARLVQRGDVRPGEARLSNVWPALLTAVEPHLDAWECDLLAVHDDPQLPAGFSYASIAPVP